MEYKHYGNPVKILKAACKTVGISIDYISKILADRSGNFEDINSIDVGDWCYICSLLKLDIGCISYGYSSVQHSRCIGEAFDRGKYDLPMTNELKEVLNFYKTEQKNDKQHPQWVGCEYLHEDYQALFSRIFVATPFVEGSDKIF